MAALRKIKTRAIPDNASHVMGLYGFICGELMIPSKDVAMRVQVALSVSAAFYAQQDDTEIIRSVMGALIA